MSEAPCARKTVIALASSDDDPVTTATNIPDFRGSASSRLRTEPADSSSGGTESPVRLNAPSSDPMYAPMPAPAKAAIGPRIGIAAHPARRPPAPVARQSRPPNRRDARPLTPRIAGCATNVLSPRRIDEKRCNLVTSCCLKRGRCLFGCITQIESTSNDYSVGFSSSNSDSSMSNVLVWSVRTRTSRQRSRTCGRRSLYYASSVEPKGLYSGLRTRSETARDKALEQAIRESGSGASIDIAKAKLVETPALSVSSRNRHSG
jgi:hypothetical protein